jgi:hypothetical protein
MLLEIYIFKVRPEVLKGTHCAVQISLVESEEDDEPRHEYEEPQIHCRCRCRCYCQELKQGLRRGPRRGPLRHLRFLCLRQRMLSLAQQIAVSYQCVPLSLP